MTKTTSKANTRKRTTAEPSRKRPTPTDTKQDEVLTMLRSKKGTTVHREGVPAASA